MSSIPGTSGSNQTVDSLIVKQKGISRHVLNKLAEDFKKEQKCKYFIFYIYLKINLA